MPRRPRLDLPGVPLHITHRGVNRCAIFIDEEDRHHYLRLLGLFARKEALAIHAYVLMSNHVHLLVSSLRAGAASAALRRTAQCYVQMFNHRHCRSGTLFEGRFKSCLVSTDSHVLRVCRYIERNPVRAAMAPRAEDYRWSSVHASLASADDPLITPHGAYLALGGPAERAAWYREWLQEGLGAGVEQRIRDHLQQERALGHPQFQAMVARTLNRPAAVRPRGRPRKTVGEPAT